MRDAGSRRGRGHALHVVGTNRIASRAYRKGALAQKRGNADPYLNILTSCLQYHSGAVRERHHAWQWYSLVSPQCDRNKPVGGSYSQTLTMLKHRTSYITLQFIITSCEPRQNKDTIYTIDPAVHSAFSVTVTVLVLYLCTLDL
jgi:hypothetical protein